MNLCGKYEILLNQNDVKKIANLVELIKIFINICKLI